MVYLDCPRETRFLRESPETQKNLSKFKNRYWKAEDYYLETELPKDRADVVIKWFEENLNFLFEKLRFLYVIAD